MQDVFPGLFGLTVFGVIAAIAVLSTFIFFLVATYFRRRREQQEIVQQRAQREIDRGAKQEQLDQLPEETFIEEQWPSEDRQYVELNDRSDADHRN